MNMVPLTFSCAADILVACPKRVVLLMFFGKGDDAFRSDEAEALDDRRFQWYRT